MKKEMYTKDQLEQVAQLAAQNAVRQMLQSNANLDNCIKDSVAISKGDNDMARVKQKVTLLSGDTVWLTGDTMGDAINNLLARFAVGQQIKRNIPTLQEYGDKWFDLYHCKKVKWNTAQNTRIYLDKHIYPIIGDKHLNEITHDDIQVVFNSMESKAKSTVEKIQITLNQILKNAKEDGYIENNVMDSSRYVMSNKVSEREALSLKEAQDIISQLNNLTERDKLLVALILFTGLRRGEALALTWDNIDMDNRIICVKHSITFKNNRPVVCGTKSKAGIREVPIIEELYEILKQCKDKAGYLIKNSDNEPLSEKAYQRTWERIRKTIDLHNATAHVFRHTFATIMEPRTDIKTLQTIMGHADTQTTMNRYTHKIDENIKALSKIDSFVDTKVDTKNAF